jgi:hypothetical protein
MTDARLGRAAIGVGALLVLGSFVFLLQLGGAVEEALARESEPVLSDDGVRFPVMGIYDFFLTREVFFGAHIWLAWAAIKGGRSWREQTRGARLVALLGAIVLTVTHAEGLWLARHGASVGIW